jgi:beta-lactam-binding protein with PASTA domain
VTIPDGQTSTTLVIEPVDDLLSEAPEAVVATLTSGAGYAVGSTANATVTIEDNETALVFGEGDIWRYFKGVTFPGADWNALSFDDGSWLTGPSGLGYGDGDDNTVLDDMRGNYLTVYMRRDFTIADPTAVTSLSLSVDYDDGFVAFINGTEVARAGVPQGQDEGTLATGHEAGSPEVIDLPAGPGALVPGRNVFAIEVHNATLSSSDLTMIPELTVNSGAGACSDGVDNDADGLTDFPLDPGCESTTDGSERSPDLTCDDGTDNDGDGLVDLADPGCSEPADTTETSSGLVCDDGIDNDNDGATDFPNDPGCDDGLDASELSDVACDDGIDNDGDGLIDFGSDPGCQSLSDTSEVDDPIILQIPLTTGNDDAEEKSDGSITLTSSDLEMLEYDAGPPHQAVGIRFDGVTIPPGATVSGAYIQFVADQTDSVQTDLTIQAHAIGDAPAFTTATNNITDRPVTTATVEWDVAPWSAGSSGPDQASADVSPILNELIARGDWSAGNAVAFVITGTGERVAASFNASPDPTTTLHLEYVTEPSGNTAPSVAITAPASGTTVVEGTVVNFTGTATDAEDGDLGSALAWSSSLTGALGTGSAISTNLSVGVHTITAGATDSGGLLGEAQITVTVEAAPIDVPDVTGQSQASAEAQLIAAGLNVGTITTAASDTVPAGDVLSQDPTACSVCASPGDPVDLVVSSGPSPNTAPNVAITAPASGTTVVEGTVVNFTGTANDAEDGDLGSALVWSSSEDGALGTGSAIATNLSVGSHTITAAATDSGGLVGSDQITVTVTAAPVDVPDVTGQTQADAEASLVAAGLSVGDVTVQSSTSVPAGVVIDQSPTACSVCASPGDPVDLVVSSGPANTAPGVTITTPADGTSIVEGTQLDLGATATDAEDGDLTSAITWSSSEDGALGGGGVVSVSVSVGVHIITASVTDTGGLVGSDQITVTVTAAPIDVPDVTGQSQADAEAELVAAGLSVGVITTAVSDTVPAGNVLSQDPSACSVCASPGDPVDLVVSSGPPANTAPTLTITAPANNSTAVEGVAVTFTATASDAEQGDLSGTVVWSSNRDGILGSGASLSVPLTRGRHVITATVTDAGGLQGSGQVVVRVRRDRS